MDPWRIEKGPKLTQSQSAAAVGAPIPLSSVLITEELARRPSRAPQYEAENRALLALADELANSPATMLQRLVELAMGFCRAQSAGVSILESENGAECFRWHAITGRLNLQAGGTIPRQCSPCSTVLERNSAQLFRYPEQHYQPPMVVEPPIYEALFAPFHLHGKPAGTLFIMSHDRGCHFDAEDQRLLESLAKFAASAYQVIISVDARKKSDERYRTLFSSIDEGFCIVEVILDAMGQPCDCRFLETNPSFALQTGISNVQGKTMRGLAPRQEQRWFDIFGRVALTGLPARFQQRAEQLGRWYDVFAFRIDEPSLRHVAILFSDITTSKQFGEALAESEDRLRSIVHNLAEGLVIVDPRTGALERNRAAQQIYGQMPHDAMALSDVRQLYELFRLDGTPVPPQQWPVACLMRSEDVPSQEYILRRKADGRERILNYRGTVVYDLHGKAALGLLSIRDVTDLKQAQHLVMQNEKLATVGRMAATIAHEINNPLAAAMNALYLASDDPNLRESSRNYLEFADRELRRIAHITKQTLGFYRETGCPVTLLIPDMLDGTLDLFVPKLKNKSLRIDRRYRGSGKALAFEGELRQVFSNLIANSIDAMSSGGTIHVRTAPWNFSPRPMVRVTIADHGCGIRPEDLKRIFEPFFTTKKAFGTGLGLWVARELITKQEGSIRLRSKPGHGTVFSIWIPSERRSDARTASMAS